MGMIEADVYKVEGLTPNQKKKLMIADNKIFDLGVDNLEVFDQFLIELKDDVDIPGFDEDILRSMVSEAENVTDKLKEYGTVDDDEIAAMKAAKERKDALMAKAARTPTPTSRAGKTQKPDDEECYIVCGTVVKRYGNKAEQV
jgi:hypothetical protein